MKHSFKRNYEKLLFALALTMAGLSTVWFWRQRGSIRTLRAGMTSPVLSASVYVAANWHPPELVGTAWSEPPSQSRGPGWRYEVFTPPLIYHDAAAGTFATTPPAQIAEPDGGTVGLELLAVRLKPYRLQLLGYFGAPGDYLAAFVSPLSSETLLARPGRRFEALGLALKSFDVRKVNVEGGEIGPACEVAAFAVLQDEPSGAEVVLDSRTLRLTDTPLAVFKMPGAAGQERELLEGDTFASDRATYRIVRIQLDPPEVGVARMTPERRGPETQVLRPIAQDADTPVPPKPLVPRKPTDVAHHDQEIPSS